MKNIFYFIKPYWYIYVFLSLLMIGKFVIELFFAQFIMDMIDNAVRQNLSQVKQLLLFVLVLVIVFTISNYLYTLIERSFQSKFRKNIRKNVYEHVLKYRINYFEKNHYGDLISKFNNDINILSGVLGHNLLMIFFVPIGGLIVFIYLTTLSFKLALFSVFLGPINLVLSVLLWKMINKNSKLSYENLSSLNSFFIDAFSGLKEIKIFNLYKLFTKKGEHINNNIYKFEMKNNKIGSIFVALTGIFSNLSFILTIVFGAYLITIGEISVGTLMAFITLVQYIFQPFVEMGQIISKFAEGMPASNRVYQILDEEPERNRMGQKISKLHTGINIKNVSFSFGDKDVFKDLNMFIPANKVTSIIGANGAGKSTVFSLLLNLYEINSGEILFDDTNINKINKDNIRSIFSLCEHNSHLFQGSIEENISYGNPLVSKDKIIEAAQLASAHEFINELPSKYNTCFGGENGVNFSSGQKQRILLARAFLKDAPVLLVDEATSSVDSESSFKIQQAISRTKKQKTSIIITHNLKTTQDSDLIIVMDKGKVVEQGIHEELLNKKGFYYNLYNQSNTEQVVISE